MTQTTEMPVITGEETFPSGRTYWRSLDELANQPEFKAFVEREFPAGASELEGFNRRQFMKVMAASFGLAGLGLTGCRRPEQYIAPYVEQPERIIPGVPVYYASAHPFPKGHIPVVVETHSARPTKIEGNPAYKAYGGSTDTFTQASVLDLYDIDRARYSTIDQKKASPAEIKTFINALNDQYSQSKGKGLGVLLDSSTSPTRRRLIKALKKKMPESVIAEYEPAVSNNPELAAKQLFGKPLRPIYHFKKAKRILSLDADFLHTGGGALRHARDFADARRVVKASDHDAKPQYMNRLYQVESTFTPTGGMADHRLRLSASQMPAFIALVAAEIATLRNQPRYAQLLEKAGGDLLTQKPDLAGWIEACAKDLIGKLSKHANIAPGEAVVIAGDHLPQSVHHLVYLLNDLIGATGKTVELAEIELDDYASISELTNAMIEGKVDTLVIFGGNPMYNAPTLGTPYRQAQKKLAKEAGKSVVYFGSHYNETAVDANVHIAASHYLESWSDGLTYEGTYIPVQPTIMPLFETHAELTVLADITGIKPAQNYADDAYAHVRETFGGEDKAFETILFHGLDASSGYTTTKPALTFERMKPFITAGDFGAPILTLDRLELRIVPSHNLYDGRFANNGWMQEVPEVMTKHAWGNALLISPKLAKHLGYDPKTAGFPVVGPDVAARDSAKYAFGHEQAPVFALNVEGVTIKVPVHIQLGLPDSTVVLTMGYGRTRAGRVGNGYGVDAFQVFSTSSLGTAVGVSFGNREKKAQPIANTQEHWAMEGRAIVREATAEEYQKHPKWVKDLGMESHAPKNYGAADDWTLQEKVTRQPQGNSLYAHPQFPDVHDKLKEPLQQQWGMTIDLNTCIACNTCVVACQAENNIPVVGAEQVKRGREMHWIRLDRYYSAGHYTSVFTDLPEDPQVVTQPIMCMHCENAPCESVCPVNATVHDEQGLNVMAYNRCVGTRYCANNCPYKVRRFNFFDWNKREVNDNLYKGPLGEKNDVTLRKFVANPDVTVRMRGVMEKCTFCVQRIQEAKINQKAKVGLSRDVKVPDGVIKVACQQACPTDSIVFGDVSDPDSKVSKMKESDRNYSLLGYLNVRPRLTYLGKLRNPNPEMPETFTYAYPATRNEIKDKKGYSDEKSHDGHGKQEPASTYH